VQQDYSPSKVVHILRNPLDNLVARMHLGAKRRAAYDLFLPTTNSTNSTAPEDKVKAFQDTSTGLLNWCSFIDKNFEASGYTATWLTYQPRALELFAQFPCYSDLFRYVQWHNLAIEVYEQQLDVPVHVMYYEDYTVRYVDTVRALNEFLEVDEVQEPAPFQTGKTYAVYSEEQIKTAAKLVKFLATPKSWELLRRYFPGMDDADGSEEKDGMSAADLSIKRNRRERFVVWLLSLRGSVRKQ